MRTGLHAKVLPALCVAALWATAAPTAATRRDPPVAGVGEEVLDLIARRRVVDRERNGTQVHGSESHDMELGPVREHDRERVASGEHALDHFPLSRPQAPQPKGAAQEVSQFQHPSMILPPATAPGGTTSPAASS